MRKFLCTLIVGICISTFTGKANELVDDMGTITGRIIDKKTSEPVSYASVALINENDTSIMTGVISNDKGIFELTDVPYGKYTVRVSFIGYKSTEVNDIEISRKNKKIELSSMELTEEMTSLDEVVIKEERLKGEEKIDRTVFTLNDDIRKTSTSGLDVLKHIPSVDVDFQENVRLEGRSDIQFYVDGVLRNKDFLAQLDPQMIDKVELLTNPGVKYDSDVSGIINIVLKKVKSFGVNGSVKIPVPHPQKIIVNPRANIEYGNQKIRVYAGDRLHLEKFEGSQKLITRLDESYNDPYRFEKFSNGINRWQNNYMNYGFDWFINGKTSLNFLGEWRNWRGITDDFLSKNSTYRQHVLSEYYETNTNSLTINDNHYFSLFFKRKLNKEGSELTAESYFNKQSGTSENNYTDTYFNSDDFTIIDNELFRNDITDNLKNTIEVKLDYSFFLKKIKNEAGIRSYTSWMDNNIKYNYSAENPLGDREDQFQYQERRQAAYYNVLGKFGKFQWQIGFRGEYSYIDINNTTTTDYFVFLPQFSVTRSLEKEQNVKFSFRKRINRPSINSLNPFETWTDSLHLKKGNPDLRPTIENSIELTYSKNFGNNFLSPKLYLRHIKNGIQDVSSTGDNGVTEIFQDNIGEEIEYGININTALQLIKRWRFNGNFSLYNKRIDSKQALSLEKYDQKLSYRLGITNIFILPKEFSLFAVSYYNSPNISYQREFSRDLLVIFGVEKKLSGKASIEMFYNPFIKNFTYTKVKTRSQGYYEEWEGMVDVHHIFSIEFSYNFSYGRKIKKINRSVEYEKEESGGAL